MDKNINIYIILVIISLSFFYIIIKYKSKLLKRKQVELNEKNNINKHLTSLFYQLLKNK